MAAMPNPIFPATLKPIVSGYQIGAPSGGLQAEVGGGPARFGLQWEAGQQVFDVPMLLTPAQFTIWTLFYHRVIALGTIPFDMRIDSGFGVQPLTVNIAQGSYSAARAGNLWSVRFQVLATNPVYDLTDAEIAALFVGYGIYGDETGLLFDALYRYANINSLVLAF